MVPQKAINNENINSLGFRFTDAIKGLRLNGEERDELESLFEESTRMLHELNENTPN